MEKSNTASPKTMTVGQTLAEWLSLLKCRPVFQKSQVRSPVRAHAGGSQSTFLSHISVFLSLSPFLTSINLSSGED